MEEVFKGRTTLVRGYKHEITSMVEYSLLIERTHRLISLLHQRPKIRGPGKHN